MSRQGVVFSREQLLDAVWGHDRAVTDRTVDVYILRLRQKIELDPVHPGYIRSVRGFGYSFNEATEPVQAASYGAASTEFDAGDGTCLQTGGHGAVFVALKG